MFNLVIEDENSNGQKNVHDEFNLRCINSFDVDISIPSTDTNNLSQQNQQSIGVPSLSENQVIRNQVGGYYSELIKMNCFLKRFLKEGGEGKVFSGYNQNGDGNQISVFFKIIKNTPKECIQQQVDLFNMNDQNKYINKLIEWKQLSQSTHLLILEKCQHGLLTELKLIKEKGQFSLQQLLHMIFDLIDGLIQFRTYNIVHLDIKPSNILVSYSQNYLYTDLGISEKVQKDQQIRPKGYTQYYSPNEQLRESQFFLIDHKTDVFSLGKTFETILSFFKQVNENHQEIAIAFENILMNMIQISKDSRQDCLLLHNQFFNICTQLIKESPFYEKYETKVINIISTQVFDIQKDIPYPLEMITYYQHVQLKLNRILDKDSKAIWELLNSIAQQYYSSGQYYSSLDYSQQALRVIQEFHQNLDHPDIAYQLDFVSANYRAVGDFKRALKISLESHKMRRQLYGKKNNIVIAKSLNQISTYYHLLGNYKKALKFSLNALRIRNQLNNQNQSDIAESYDSLSRDYRALGDYRNSLFYSQQSLEVKRKLYQKENHRDIALSYNEICTNYITIGDYQKAIQYLKKYIRMSKNIYKENHLQLANSFSRISESYHAMKDYNNALIFSLQSLQMRERIFIEQHPIIAESLSQICRIYYARLEFKLSLQYALKSLDMRKQIFLDEHPDIANSLCLVSFCYHSLGDYQKALSFQFQSLQIRKKLNHRNHRDIAQTVDTISSIYAKIGDYKEALSYSLRVLKMRNKSFNCVHKEIADSGYQRIRDNITTTIIKFLAQKKFNVFIVQSEMIKIWNI